MINHENEYRADDCHKQAIEVEPRHPRRIEKMREDKAADKGPDDAEDEIKDKPIAPLVYQFAGDEASDQSEHDPSDNAYLSLLLIK